MEISLSPEVEKLVQQYVERGLYPNASMLIDEAVHLLLEMDRAEAKLVSFVQEGLESGPPKAISAQDWKQLREEIHALHTTRYGE